MSSWFRFHKGFLKLNHQREKKQYTIDEKFQMSSFKEIFQL